MTTVLVGRSAACDIVVDDPTVSRRHAALTRTAVGAYRFVDQGSTSGSYRMEAGVWQPMMEAVLRGGDRVRLGDYETTVAALIDRAAMPVAPADGSATGYAGAAGEVSRTPPVGGETEGPPRQPADAPPEGAPGDAVASREEPRPPRRVVERDPATGRIMVRLR